MRTKLKDGEKIILTLKQHPFVLVPIILLNIIVLGIAIYFTLYPIIIINLPLHKFFYAVFVILLFLLLWQYLNWGYNLWIVTNQRVIDEWGFLSSNAKESPLNQIQNITANIPFIGMIFGFGDLRIQTAAEKGSSVIYMVSHPKKLKETISDARDAAIAKKTVSADPVDSGDTKECPYCAEIIKAKAKLCRFCQKDLQ